MQDSIAQSIIILATNDPETDHEQLEALKAVCSGIIKRKEPPALVTTLDAQVLLGRGLTPASVTMLYKLEREGKLHRAPRTGRKVYYYRSELEKLVYGETA